MPDKKPTDKQLIELLQYKSKTGCDLCDIKNGNWCITCNYDLMSNALNLINRLQAENERLKKTNKNMSAYVKGNNWGLVSFVEFCKNLKAEAYKEFYEKLHTEILAARDSNFKAKEERIAKSKKYGIPIDVEDNFLMYCDGKIHALDGIDYFAYETYKEMVGEDNA